MKNGIVILTLLILACPLAVAPLCTGSLDTAMAQEIIVSDFQVNENAGSADQHSVVAAQNGSGTLVMVWVDERNGDSDIYGQRFSGDGTPLGDNFRMNDDNGVASQISPSVAIDSSGDFVAAWSDYRDPGDEANIYARRFSSDGTPLGGDFKVNDDTNVESHSRPSVSIGASGAFVVAFEDYRNGDADIYAQRYADNGTALGSNFLVNDDATGTSQNNVSLAADAGGNFVAVWMDSRDSDNNIYAQRYSYDGIAQGFNFKVNDDAGSSRQHFPVVAYDGMGDFAVSWTDERGAYAQIYAQRYAGDGTPQGVNFQVTQDIGTTSPNSPSISKDDTGKFVIAWQAYMGSDLNIYAQRLASDGSALGGNFLVNDDVGEVYQQEPSVAMDGSGNFVIAWYDSRNLNTDIYAQLYSSGGAPLGANFMVNQDTGSAHQFWPVLSLLDSGGFVIAWEDERNGYEDIYAQIYTSDATVLGANFIVNDDGFSARQVKPSVSGNSAGQFVIAWQDMRNNGDPDVYAQMYDSGGNPMGVNVVVNDDGGGSTQYYPSVAMGDSGRFAVVWQDNRNGNNDIYAQRFDSDGSDIGVNFLVNDDGGSYDQNEPSIAVSDDGGFVIAWEDSRNGDTDIYAQRFSATGTPQGANAKVNDDPGTVEQYSPAVSFAASGDYVIAWGDDRADDGDIYARRYSADGTPLGGNFLVNDDGAGVSQSSPSVAADSSGKFVIAWYDDRGGEGDDDIYAQRYESDGTPVNGNFMVTIAGEKTQMEPDLKLWSGRIYATWRDSRSGDTGFDIWANIRAWDGLTGMGNDTPTLLPFAARLGQNYPNPFNPSTTIEFDIPGEAGAAAERSQGKRHPVELLIYDMRGRLVRTLVDSECEPGHHTVYWNGRSDTGGRVSSGLYLFTLKTGGDILTRKMTIVK